jgi:glutamine amidotransferase
MIVIIDYDAGNLFSVQKAVEFIGAQASISSYPEDIIKADKVIFPGVGSFGNAIKTIRKLNLEDPIQACIQENKPFLGICLGLQLLFEKSQESPDSRGLGILEGEVKRFSYSIKVPHLGWNVLNQVQQSPLWQDIPEKSYFYYAHSYYVQPENQEIITGQSDYNGAYTVAVKRNNLYGLQFHPEKSQKWGLEVLKNFIKLER